LPLQSGTRLGPYEILSAIGAGGMGEVYRARDAKLNRDVAIKVLPDGVASDPDRLARFHREAQVLAAFNHPNIAHIHGYEDSGGVHALVMELVEGPTLADRIAQGYLQPFNGGTPGAETKWQVSTSTRASDPRWRADGKELFYLEPVVGTRRLKLMSVPIGSGPSPAGTPKLLFEFQSVLTVPQANLFTYSPSADGQRFLINVIATDVQPSLEVILNWAGSGNAR
jgi:hypothetical protein